MQDIARKYQTFKTDAQRDKAFAQAFGKTDLDTQRGLRALFDSGVLVNLRQLDAEISKASGTIARDLPDAINNSVDQVDRLKAALSQAADDFARPFNDAIAGGIAMLLDGEGLSGKQLLGGAAAAGVAGYGALKLAGMGLSRLGSKAAGGLVATVARQAGLAGLKLPLPVYVVNKQMSLTREAMLGQTGGKQSAGPALSGSGRRNSGKTAAAGLPRRGGLGIKAGAAGAALALSATTPVLLDSTSTAAQKVDAVTDMAGGALGGWGGAALGAKMGAGLGTMVAPGVGTAIGGTLGGIIGGVAGSELGQMLVAGLRDLFGLGREEDDGSAQAMQQAARTMLDAAQQVAAAIPAGGIAVDVNVTGNAQASITRGKGSVYSGVSYAQGVAEEMME